jgi:hypothetical protein
MAFGFGFGMPRIFSASRAFNPASLFANGEQGWWFDPSNLSTLFQDAAGTTPVTAVEQPVGLQLDLSKGLVPGPELVTNGNFSGGTTGWTYFVGGTSTASISGGQATITKGSGIAYIAQSLLVQNTVYSCTLDIVSITGTASVQNGNGASYGSFTTAGTKTFTFMHNVANANMYLSADSGTVVFDNVSIKQVAGNHRFQTTSANRPVVSARVNLLTKTEQFDDAAWVKQSASITPNSILAPNGTLTADKHTSTGTTSNIYQIPGTFISGVNYTLSRYVKAGSRSFCTVALHGLADAYFDLTNLTYSFSGTGAVSASIEDVGDGWRKVSATYVWGSGTTYRAYFAMASSLSSQVVSVNDDIYLWGADLRVTNQGVGLPVYQRVNTSTDYDSTGFPIYIKPNGSNQFMQTNSINFTATDKMTVWQGVRKLSDAAFSPFIELSASAGANIGAFNMSAPGSTGVADYGFSSRGTAGAEAKASGYAAPITNVLTGIGNISGDLVNLRVNGALVSQSTADQGTGNYGNWPAYFYARNAVSNFFGGNDYGSIARGAASTAAQITAGETYINTLTKAY